MRNLILFLTILSSYSYLIKPKYCINCKHFIENKKYNQFSKCSKFKKFDNENDYLIAGINPVISEKYYYCTTARNLQDMCGKQGKKYEEKDI